MAERLMLLDSASMYFRAYYGVPDRFHAKDGTPVNAVRGFLDAVARLISTYEPDAVVACWDNNWRPQFRVDLVPSYKAHRVVESVASTDQAADTKGDEADRTAVVAAGVSAADVEEVPDPLEVQVPIIVDILAALGITRVGAHGYEADDVIAHYARAATSAVDIVTGDRDLFQLVDATGPRRVLYTARSFANLDLVDDAWLLAKYGVDGRQYADFSLMRGDSSDGLPGVVGVGEKTAAKLIQRFEDLTSILSAADDSDSQMAPGLRQKLLVSREYLARADGVVRLQHTLDVPPAPTTFPGAPADEPRLRQLSDSNNLQSSVARLSTALGWSSSVRGSVAGSGSPVPPDRV